MLRSFKAVISDRGLLVLGGVVIVTSISAYYWGTFIQANRATFRTPGRIEYFLSEASLYVVFMMLIYLQRTEHFGDQFSWQKFIVFQTMVAIAVAHLYQFLGL